LHILSPCSRLFVCFFSLSVVARPVQAAWLNPQRSGLQKQALAEAWQAPSKPMVSRHSSDLVMTPLRTQDASCQLSDSHLWTPLLCVTVQIAAGNGEQVLSRDVRRLAHNMDFTRLMSWYHTGAQYCL
jgi:hypothetical protein